MRLKFAFR